MFDSFNFEMATLKTLGDWLDGSDWVQAQVQVLYYLQNGYFSCAQLMSSAQHELTKSLQLHSLSCSTEPMTATVRENLQRQMISSSLELPERRRCPSVPVLVNRGGTGAAVANLCVFPAGDIL